MHYKTAIILVFLIIIGISLGTFLAATHRVHADDTTDPDDPSAVWACYPDTDANGNSIQSCGFGHYQQECDFDNTTHADTNCQQVFEPDPLPPAQLFAPILQDLLNRASLSLRATAGKGIVSWNYAPSASSSPSMRDLVNITGSYPFSELLSTATLTLDLYKGVVGSSTLMHSQQISSSTAASSFPFTFDANDSYFLALSATYPDDTYPPGQGPEDHCPNSSGDFCIIPTYPLADFQNAMTKGYGLIEDSQGALGNYVPAAYGIFELTIPAAPPAPPPISNVLFIPGTLTSRLYMRNTNGTERDLWEPRTDLDVGPLAMNAGGESLNTIYTRDLVDQLYSNSPLYSLAAKKALGTGVNVYGPFESFMDNLVTNGTIKDWRSYPYDWRYDVSDIVKNGTLVASATSTPTRIYLQDVLQQLASTSPTGKVTIIAHSNGGLIAKALAVDLQKKGKVGLIDHIVMVGTPQFGTPKSLLDMLHGSEFTQLGGLIMYSGSVRAAEETMPGPYDLLPSPAYFSTETTPVASFDTNPPASRYRGVFSDVIDSFSKLTDFAEDTFHIDGGVGLPGSTRTPIPLSKTLVQKAQATHATIDSWTPPAGLAVTTIAGWGQPTPDEIAYSGTNGLNCDRISFFIPIACSLQPQLQNTVLSTESGDDTVVAASASGLATDTLYFNAKEYEMQTKNIVVHQSLLNSSPVQTQFLDLLKENEKIERYVSATIPTDVGTSYTVISAHSPVNLLATDADGDQTGVVTISGLSGINFEKQDIPGSSIQIVDDEKYLYLPEDKGYSIQMQGYGSGGTTLDIGTVNAKGTVQTNEAYADLPTTASTTATFHVDANAVGPQSLSVDVDGTGSSTTIYVATTTIMDQNYRSSLFTLRSLFASHSISTAIKKLVLTSFKNFSAQKNPNSLAYFTLQLLVESQSGVKLTFPQGESMGKLLHDLTI